LKGTRFDDAISSVLDVLSGEIKLLAPYGVDRDYANTCDSLVDLGKAMIENADDSPERASLIADLKKLPENGLVNYHSFFQKLCDDFPLLNLVDVVAMRKGGGDDAEIEQGVKALCVALAALYK